MKHTSAYILCALIMLWAQSLLAQTGPGQLLKNLAVTGEFQMIKHQSVGIGLAYVQYPGIGSCGTGDAGYDFTFNNEFIPDAGLPYPVYSPQIGAYCNLALFYAGARLGYYTDFHGNNNVGIAPEFGVGVLTAFIVYRINIMVDSHSPMQIDRHNLTLKFILPSAWIHR